MEDICFAHICGQACPFACPAAVTPAEASDSDSSPSTPKSTTLASSQCPKAHEFSQLSNLEQWVSFDAPKLQMLDFLAYKYYSHPTFKFYKLPSGPIVRFATADDAQCVINEYKNYYNPQILTVDRKIEAPEEPEKAESTPETTPAAMPSTPVMRLPSSRPISIRRGKGSRESLDFCESEPVSSACGSFEAESNASPIRISHSGSVHSDGLDRVSASAPTTAEEGEAASTVAPAHSAMYDSLPEVGFGEYGGFSGMPPMPMPPCPCCAYSMMAASAAAGFPPTSPLSPNGFPAFCYEHAALAGWTLAQQQQAAAATPVATQSHGGGGKGSKSSPHHGWTATCTEMVLNILRENSANPNAEPFQSGWQALFQIWGVRRADLDDAVLNCLFTKLPHQQEQILLSFAAIDLASVNNLSAYLNCLIKEHETTNQVCLHFLAGLCPYPNCGYVHPINTAGWDALYEKWNITYRDLDYAVLNYLSKKSMQQQDEILLALADTNIGSVVNLSAYLSSQIQKFEGLEARAKAAAQNNSNANSNSHHHHSNNNNSNGHGHHGNNHHHQGSNNNSHGNQNRRQPSRLAKTAFHDGAFLGPFAAAAAVGAVSSGPSSPTTWPSARPQSGFLHRNNNNFRNNNKPHNNSNRQSQPRAQ